MPDRIFNVKVLYQHCEEVLGLTAYYRLQETSIDADTLQNVAQEAAVYLATQHATLRAIMGVPDKLIGIEVTAPVNEDGEGPAGFIQPVCRRGSDAGRSEQLTDMIAAQIEFTGINELDEPVRNAKFWSCLCQSDVDCMELLSTPRTEISTGFATFFENPLVLGSGNLDLVVKNARAGAGVITYHPCTDVQAAQTLASMIQRRGDITPRRGHLTPAP